MTEDKKTTDGPGRTLLFVHGRDFKPSEQELLGINTAALCAAIERDHPDVLEHFHDVEKRFAYYGDIGNEFLRGIGKNYDERLDVGDRKNALRQLIAIKKKKNFGVHRYDRLPGKTAIAEFAVGVASPILGSLGLSKKMVTKVAADLAEYWNESGDFADAVRSRVREAIRELMIEDSEVMLLTHGTGSVVAYDSLWQLSNDAEHKLEDSDRKIDMWVTLGAPLGDTTVRKSLLGSDIKGVGCFPSNVVSWHNVSAEDDYMCHDNTLADDFKSMLKEKQVSCIRDHHIYNHTVRYGKSNPHSSVGYLIHPRVAQLVADWLRNN